MTALELSDPIAYIRFAILAKQLGHAYEVWMEANALAMRPSNTSLSD